MKNSYHNNAEARLLIVPTSRGPAIKGTRLTVYAILDDLNGGEPEFVRSLYDLTDEEWAGVLHYIAEHREVLEQGLAELRRRNEEERRYWEERNRELLNRPAAPPANEKIAQARAKLAALKQELAGQGNGACKSS
jgi:uncharacterized protein (DUF433 family)